MLHKNLYSNIFFQKRERERERKEVRRMYILLIWVDDLHFITRDDDDEGLSVVVENQKSHTNTHLLIFFPSKVFVSYPNTTGY